MAIAIRTRRLLPVLLLLVACLLLIAVVNRSTSERISDAREALTYRIIADVMPLPYDNDLLHDVIRVEDSQGLGTIGPVTVYRARREGRPLGAVLMPVRAKGYNGPVDLVIGIRENGELLAVRVTNHDETEGLGDQVHQDRSNWITRFTGLSLANTNPGDWALRGDGGRFDHISGATVTPRGVIQAVQLALDYYELNRSHLY